MVTTNLQIQEVKNTQTHTRRNIHHDSSKTKLLKTSVREKIWEEKKACFIYKSQDKDGRRFLTGNDA